MVEIEVLGCMHRDLQGYEHYLRKQKRKEAVAAAFRRVENCLSEIRDLSHTLVNMRASGVSLPHELFDSGVLKFPFPSLTASNPTSRGAYVQYLKTL
jgi:hypothetical protein